MRTYTPSTSCENAKAAFELSRPGCSRAFDDEFEERSLASEELGPVILERRSLVTRLSERKLQSTHAHYSLPYLLRESDEVQGRAYTAEER